MTEHNPFERQLADEIDYEVGPPQNVDALAITRQAHTTSPRWRFINMSSTIKFAAAGTALALFGAAFLIAVPNGTSPDDGVVAPPAAVAAQMEGEGTTTYMLNLTCEGGQESPLGLPPCEFDGESADRSGFGRVLDEGHVYFTLANPAITTGALEGMQVLDGAVVLDVADNSIIGNGLLYWVGTVEGCGAGSFYAEAEFAAIPVQVYDEQSGNFISVNDFSVNTFTIVPGGSLPITGTWDGTGTETLNADGSLSQASTFTYSCEEAS